MPTTDTTVNNLIINKLTKAQYDNIQSPSDTELYLVPDEIDSVPTSGSENPVTSDGIYTALQGKLDKNQESSNAGKSLVVGNDGVVSPDVAPLSKLTVSIPFGQVDSTSTSTTFTATVDGITELRDGICCYLRNGVVTSASGFTINVNNLGPKPVYNTMAAATAFTTQFNVNYTMLFIYNSTRVSGGCWDMYVGYDTNSTYNLNSNYVSIGHIEIGAYPIAANSLCAFDIDDKLTPFVTTATTSTGKTLVPSVFPIGAKIFASTYTFSPNSVANNLSTLCSTLGNYDLRYSSVNHNVAIFPNTNYYNRIFMPVIVNVQNDTFTLTTQTTSGYNNNFTNGRSLIKDSFYVEIGFNSTNNTSYYYYLLQENRLYYYDGTRLIEYSIYKLSIIDVPEYTIEKLTQAETSYSASYVLKKDGTQVGATINIPKDMVVSSGEVKTVMVSDEPYQGAVVGDKYIDLTIANTAQNHIYIPVKDLVDVYIAGNGIQISNNYISVKVNQNQSNGLGVGGDGLSLGAVTPSTNGVGGLNGAMLATDKEKLDGIEIGSERVRVQGFTGQYGVFPYSLVAFAKVNGTMLLTSFTTTGGTGQKVPITSYGFPIGSNIYFYNSSEAIQQNNGSVWELYTSYRHVDARYSAITGESVSLGSSESTVSYFKTTAVFLRVMIDGEYWKPFYKENDTNEIVVSIDQLSTGNFYIYLGKTVAELGDVNHRYFQLEDNNPLYYYDGTDLIDYATHLKAIIEWQSEQDLSSKADKVDEATNGNLAGLDYNGNLTDSGLAADEVATLGTNQLTNYYKKTEIYSKSETDDLVRAASDFEYEEVATLPTASVSTKGKFYLYNGHRYVTTEKSGGVYSWVDLGSYDIDLNGYVTKTVFETEIATRPTYERLDSEAQMQSMINNHTWVEGVIYYTVEED